MNSNPQHLALAIVHQAVQASQLEEAQQALAQTQQHAAELQKAIDALVADREATKKAHAEHLEQAAAQLKAEQDALLAADIKLNDTLRRIAQALEFESVEGMMGVVNARVVPPAPRPADSEGGETA